MQPDRLIAQCLIAQGLGHGFLDAAPVGVAIDHDPRPARATQQLIKRQARLLGLDVPERRINRRDRRHGHRSPPPVGAAIKILPDVLDRLRVAADQGGDYVVGQIARHRQLAPVQSGVTKAVETFARLDPQGDEVAPGTGDDDAGAGDLQHYASLGCEMLAGTIAPG